MNEKPFYIIIEEQIEVLSAKTDEDILTDLKDLSVLPDEYIWHGKKGLDNPIWEESETEMLLVRYLAMANIIATRKLRAGVPLLLERASYGDMGETMRGLRHALEATFEPDWEALNDVCMQAASSKNRGARLWAVSELGILRDSRSLDLLFEMLHDPAELVRHQVISSLGMLLRREKRLKEQGVNRLEQFIEELQLTQRKAKDLLEEIRDS